jgi:hypothetical protein
MTKRVDEWVQSVIAMPHIQWECIDDVMQYADQVVLVSYDRARRTVAHTLYTPPHWPLYGRDAAIQRLRAWATTQRRLLKGAS